MADSGQFQMVITKHLNKMFYDRWKTIDKQYTDHYSVGKTDELYEVGAEVTGLGLIPETREGMTPEYEDPLNGFPYVHSVLDYRKGVRVTDKLYQSDKYKVFGPRLAQQLAKSANYTLEILAARPINNGFGSFLSPDGVSLFNSYHPVIGTGGTYANRPSTAAALSVSALQAGALSVRRQTDPKGKLLALRAKELVIAPDLEFSARTILSSTLLPGGSNNDVNVLSGAFDLTLWDFITSSTFWMLRDPQVKAEEVLTMKMKNAVKTSSYYDWNTRSTLYDVEFSLLIGATDWRGLYASPGS